jgi:hypothetical protein
MRKQNSKSSGFFETDEAHILNSRNSVAPTSSGDNMFSLLYPTGLDMNDKVVRSRNSQKKMHQQQQGGQETVVLHGINSEGKKMKVTNVKFNIITGNMTK